jgi:predicted ATPase
LKLKLGNYKYGVGLSESIISNNDSRELNVAGLFSKVKIYHFHDTSPTSFLRRECDLEDNLYFKQDGRNLPAFLYFLKVKHLKIYERIVKMVQSVAPYIDSFILEPSRLNEREIALRWVDSGDLESSFSAYQLSDGTLRFIALTTLLMQPAPPSVIIIDEPELGLHPFAIGKLAGMIQGVSEKAQVIVATQSPGLLSHFEPEDVIVMDRSEEEKQTVFKRLDSHELADWLNDYSLGDLWERNILNAAQPFPQVQ